MFGKAEDIPLIPCRCVVLGAEGLRVGCATSQLHDWAKCPLVE